MPDDMTDKDSADKEETAATVTGAVEARDGTAILLLVKNGLSVDWTDAEGHCLLHHAALWGDANLAERLLAQGANPARQDSAQVTPADAARGMGYDSLCGILNAAAQQAPKPEKPVLPPSLRTLGDIRAEAVAGVNYFVLFARAGCFADIMALASLQDGLKAGDLLQKLPETSDHLLYLLCETGQLRAVTVPALWRGNPQGLEQIWDEVPQGFRKTVDIDALMTGIRQLKLQARQKPRLKGFDS